MQSEFRFFYEKENNYVSTLMKFTKDLPFGGKCDNIMKVAGVGGVVLWRPIMYTCDMDRKGGGALRGSLSKGN